MDYKAAVRYINNLEKLGWVFRLKREKEVLAKLGNPHRSLKYIHIAGTNGKGSVVAFLSAILQRAGYNVAAYTSPHLVNMRERITVNNKWISKKDFARLAAKVKATKVNITYFEFITTIAFQYFAEKKPDIVLLEVGLGGRLDATNVMKPEIAVITNIALEHTRILGDTIEKIAKEKARIIKKGCVVVTGTTGKALSVVRKTAKSKGCMLIKAKETKHRLSLNGKFQKFNAGIAVAAAKHLKIKENHIKQGLMATEWPGRLEFFENILLDSAHNPNGIKKMAEFVKKLKYRNLIIVFGCLRDKDYMQMYRNLPKHDELILTKPNSDRALDPRMIPGNDKIIRNPVKAVQYAKSIATKKDLVLICGSIYLAGDVRSNLVS